MSFVDLDAALAPVGGEEPTGPDLGYDPAFAALERSAQGKPEQQIGSTVVPGEDPDWKAVQRQASELIGKTRDLRVAAYLAKALLRTNQWAGLAEGLTLLKGLIDKFWDNGLHPKLDPDDGNDPTFRINVIRELDAPEMVAAAKATPLVVSQVLGPITLRHVELAQATPVEGEAPPAGQIGQAAIDGTLADCPIETLRATNAALASCVAELAAVEAAATDKVGSENSPGLERFPVVLRKAAAIVTEALSRREPVVGADGAGAAGTNGASRVGFVAGEISSRDDVIKALDRIVAYYKKYEPSSPIPIFMERSKKLVLMTFADIVNELVPDAAGQLAVLKGRSNE
jgi:type VI secretion system protein ImpA